MAAESDTGRSALAAVAEAHGVSAQQVALAWLLHHSPSLLPIPGTSSIGHLDNNVDAACLPRRHRPSRARHRHGWSLLNGALHPAVPDRPAPGYSPALLRPAGLRRLVTAAEEAGFDAIAFWVVVDPPGDDLGRTMDLLAAYGASVIAHARPGPLPVDLQELPSSDV